MEVEESSPMKLHQPSGRRHLGLALSLLTVLMWGILPVVLKMMLEQMDAFTITWYRFLAAAIVLGIILACRGSLPRMGGHKRIIYGLLVIVTLGLGSNYALYLLGLNYISPGAAQVVIQLAPVLAMFGFLFFFKERFGKQQWFGLILLCLGMLLFFHNRLGEIFLSLGDYTLGVIFVLLSGVTWAAYALAQKQLLSIMSSPAILLVVYCGSALCLLPLSAPSEEISSANSNNRFVL